MSEHGDASYRLAQAKGQPGEAGPERSGERGGSCERAVLWTWSGWAKTRTKSKVRARVEHPIGIIKRVFGFATCAIARSKKDAHRLLVTSARQSVYGAPASTL
jgi:hypothetical protein